MKYSFSMLLLLTCSIAFAQPKVYTQAVISTTTNVIAPEEEDVQNIQNTQDQRGGMNFRNMMDGESKFVTYLKNDLVKTVIKSEMGSSTIYRDNSKLLTTTIMKMMGNTSGFFVTDQEQVEMKKLRDSMMSERRKRDTTQRQMPAMERANEPTEISYTQESKKIAGYDCKKAYLITTRFLGVKDSATIWFTPAFKLKDILSTGNLSSMGGMMANMIPTLNGLDKIDGFVMRYEMKMRRNRRMEVEVTKVELDKAIDVKEFDIPKDIEIKPMKEMQNMFGGGRGGMMRGRD